MEYSNILFSLLSHICILISVLRLCMTALRRDTWWFHLQQMPYERKKCYCLCTLCFSQWRILQRAKYFFLLLYKYVQFFCKSFQLMEKTDREYYTLDDMFVSKAAKRARSGEEEEVQRRKAIREHQQLAARMEKCPYCFDSSELSKHLIIAIGTKVRKWQFNTNVEIKKKWC